MRERDFRLVGRQILDLSEAGMLVMTESQVLTGDSVIVSFRAPLSHAWIDAEASVARVIHGRRPEDHRGRCLGIHFEYMEAGARALLLNQLGWFRTVKSRARVVADHS